MIANPKYTISQFNGMSDDGGMFYLDGFSVVKNAGKTELVESFVVSPYISSADVGFNESNGGSALANIKAIETIEKLDNSTLSDSFHNILFTGSNFFIKALDSTETYSGYIGGIPSSGTFLSINNPDMHTMLSGNILFTSSRHLGLLIRGKVKTGSSTTTIIDSEGRNFTTLGLSTSAPNNTVTNIKTGKIYTITAIGNSAATNDMLTFDAIDASANTANDEFIAIAHTKWDLDSGITYPTFAGQQQQVYSARPIKQWGVGDTLKYVILNGNYLSVLSNDESTIDNAFKQLPLSYQGLAMEINNGYFIVSAFDKRGRGHILYWDGFSDGWNKDIMVDKTPQTFENYNDGWVYLTNGTIFFTDGNQIQKIISHPDKLLQNESVSVDNINGITTLNEKIYFAINGRTNNRAFNGIMVFDPSFGLTWFKSKKAEVGFNTTSCIYAHSYSLTRQNYIENKELIIGGNGSACKINDYNSSRTAPTDFASAVFLLDFQQDTEVKEVWLNMTQSSKYYISTSGDKSLDVTVSYGDGNNGIFKRGQIQSASAVDTILNFGVNYPGTIGEQVEFTTGELAGQRTFITAISGTGNSETWTVSPSVSATTASACEARVWKLKKGEQKTISRSKLGSPQRFNVNFKGSKMYLEILIRGNTNAFPSSILDIMLF